MMSQFEKLMLIRTAILSIQLKKPDYNTKITEIEKKNFDHNHRNRYITTQEFNKLIRENFAARFKKANLGTKSDIADLLKDKYFDNKLEKMNKNVTSNKIKHVETEKKLTDLTNKVKHKYMKKEMIFLLGRTYFIGEDGYQKFFSFCLYAQFANIGQQ